MSNIKVNRENHDKARKYFGIYGNLEYDLHHKDVNLINTDPDRYNEWRPEDLMVLTHIEHSRLHAAEKNFAHGNKAHGLKNGANTHPEKNNFVNGFSNMYWKGTHYYNNGEIEVRAKECPKGFIKGRLKGCFGRTE